MSKNNPNLGRAVREAWSGGRGAPNPQNPSPLFHVGIVMDDSDEDQRNGRVWVYIPYFSSSRGGEIFATDGLPNYGGTTPDRRKGRLEADDRLRTGWILCSPIMPFFGSDESRVEQSPDNRNARSGDVNSYGTWLGTPRIGDHVAVLFANGDPGKAYYFGCVPKQNRNFMVPGVAAAPVDDLAKNYNPGHEPSEEEINFALPALDKAQVPKDDKKWVASTFADHIQQAGLITDTHRGAGTSSSRRESPSLVFGMKTPGWSYDAEKYNKDTDGVQFKDKKDFYQSVNTTGHQFVMDDHPNHQSIRLRTSYGSQLYFNDSCDEPYIYISTAKGNVWIELVDDGDINVFGEGSFSVHAKEDINLVADRDVNIEAKRNLNVRSLQKGVFAIHGETHMHLGQAGAQGVYITNYGDFNQTIGNDYKLTVLNDLNVIANQHIKQHAGQNYNQSAGNELRSEAAGDYSVTSGGTYREWASFIHMNSNPGSPADQAIGALLPHNVVLNSVAASPSIGEVYGGIEASGRDMSIASTVPQHQPWVDRCGRRRGTNGHVEPNEPYTKRIRRGNTRSNARKPLPVMGKVNGQAGVYEGEDYSTNNIGEAPKYVKLRDLAPGEAKPASEYTQISEDMANFLKKKEGFVACPYRDYGGLWTIGYGHLIRNGDVINGRPITLAELDRTNGGCDQNRISREEADVLFRTDVARFERAVSRQVTSEITQGQYDACVSLSYNIGTGAFGRSTALRCINAGDFEKVPEAWMMWNKVKGQPVRGLTNRRREELEKFFNYIPVDPPVVELGGDV